MAVLHINPRYRDWLVHQGLADVAALQAVQATVVSGHPDRHVLQGTLGNGADRIDVYIKRQHRVRWKERLANAWAGFGWVSQSLRERRTLEQLRVAGVPAPDWIAAGEDNRGRAFLILRTIPDCRDLPSQLRGPLGQRPAFRRRLARQLGEALARMHDAGIQHGDLYAKHVLIQTSGQLMHFLDWQRARIGLAVGWPNRWRDLAALDATLADELASTGDRLACLRAYLLATLPLPAPREFRRRAIRQIRQNADRLLRQRRIREQRQTPIAIGSQRLIWLDGERLCVTPAFRQAFPGPVPDWLLAPADEERPIVVPGSAKATLIHRSSDELTRWLWSRLRRRRLTSPEVRQAALLFRLQRYGVHTPRLLAFGQRHPLPWRTESFLLTDVPRAGSLLESLRASATWTAERKQRWRLIRLAGDLLRRVHDASCHGVGAIHQLSVLNGKQVVLEEAAGLSMERGLARWQKQGDLSSLRGSLPSGLCSRTDLLRFILAYRGERRLTPATRQFLQPLLGGARREARQAA